MNEGYEKCHFGRIKMVITTNVRKEYGKMKIIANCY